MTKHSRPTSKKRHRESNSSSTLPLKHYYTFSNGSPLFSQHNAYYSCQVCQCTRSRMSFLICGSGTTAVLNNAIIDDIIQDKMGWTDKRPHKNSSDSSSGDQKERCIAHQRVSLKTAPIDRANPAHNGSAYAFARFSSPAGDYMHASSLKRRNIRKFEGWPLCGWTLWS